MISSMNTPQRRTRLLLPVIGLALLLAVGLWFIFAYANKEKERDHHTWEALLGAVVDNHARNVSQWLDAQTAVVQELANNTSVRFYLTQLAATEDKNVSAEHSAQVAYLRNLLEATAERNHFSRSAGVAKLPANVEFAADAGLVIVDKDGKTLTESTGFRTDDTLRATMLEVIKSGKPALQDIYSNRRGEIVLGFVVPVFHIQQSNDGQMKPLGAIAGVKRANDELFPLLSHKGTLTSSDETLLVRREADAVSYITPLKDGTQALRKRLPVTNPELSEAHAVNHPGTFAHKQDYAGRDVLMVSRAFTQAPWVLVEKVDANEALRESREHQRFLLTSLILTMLAAAAALVAAWWYGASMKERTIAADLRSKSRELAQQTALLQQVMNGTPDLIFTIASGHLLFCNKALAELVGENVSTLSGKTMSSILGPAASQPIDAMVHEAEKQGKAASRMLELEIGGQHQIYYFTAIPIDGETHDGRKVLCICRNMTAEQQAQTKRQGLMQQLVTTLTRAVDLHDPFCAEHSTRTAQVAVAVGKALGLDASMLETLEMASRLANVGKMYLPRELLTKLEPLTAEDHALLQTHVQHSVDLLKGLDFDGPVITIIAQKNEHVDGSGYPLGLKGNDLLLPSRILAVANTFVAMVSARAYRAGKPLKETLDQLLKETGSRYDRHVVAALFHVAENRQEWSSWSAPL
jgi:HD-GYP domain-containing protein (c-di-GMP phosphodiesterase class II)